VEQNVQCWKKTKETTNKGREFKTKRIMKWLKEVWVRRKNAVVKKRQRLVLNALWVTEHRS